MPASGDVNVHFHIRMPGHTPVVTRAADIEAAVNRIALLVFQQEDGTGEFLYQYTAESRNFSQDDDTEADFEAMLRVTDEPVKLLAIANYPDGLLSDIAVNTPEAEVRKALIGTTSSLQGMPMTGVKEVAGITTGMGTVRIPMLRSVAKITIDMAPGVDNFEMLSIRIYRSFEEFQYFPDLGAILNENGDGGTPMASIASIPEKTTATIIRVPPIENYYYNFITESVANDVWDEAMCIVVGGLFDGSETETYYRMDFDTDPGAPIANLMGQALRNFWYQFTILSVSGPGWPTPEDAANTPATALEATVLPWSGNGDTEYYFGKDRYIILSKAELTLGTEVGDEDLLYITTSELPFTVTSERDPDNRGPVSTFPEGLKASFTDNMNFDLTDVGGVPPGQRKWALRVTAKTTDPTDDYMILTAAGGLINIRIYVRRSSQLSVERIGTLETVPNTGTPDRTTGEYSHYVEYKVHIPEARTWSATITAQGWVSGSSTDPHPAYLLDPATGQPVGTTISGQAGTTTLRVGFDQLFYPKINESPVATITVYLDGSPLLSQTFTVVQDPLPLPTTYFPTLNVFDDMLQSLVDGRGIEAFTSYLKNSALYGPTNGVVPMPTFRLTSWIVFDTEVVDIDASYRFLYTNFDLSAASKFSQVRHDAVNTFWQKYGNERILFYLLDVPYSGADGIFAGATGTSSRESVLSMLGMRYLAPGDATTTVTIKSAMATTPVYRYLTQDGPFGAVNLANVSYAHNTHPSGVDPGSLPTTAVPVLVDADNGAVLLLIDPGNGVVFLGEDDIIGPGYVEASVMAAGKGAGDDKSRFLANLIAYIVNCGQYGSGFADLFLPGNEVLYNAAFPPAP